MTSPPVQHHTMLLAQSPAHHGGGGLLHHHHQLQQQHHNAIRTPPRNSSPRLASLSLAESPSPAGPSHAESSANASPSSSSLFIDNQGQMHDPGYQSALRSLHAQIGARASPVPGKRPTSSGKHAPSRPSHLGLGLSGHEHGTFHKSFSSSDEDSSDEEDEEGARQHDSYTTLFEEARKADRSGSHSSTSHTPVFNVSISRPSSPPQLPPSSSASPRHLSFSTHHGAEGQTGSPNEKKVRRASWAARPRSSSATRTPPKVLPEADRKGANDANNWGFTGLVDWEREQRVARESSEVNGDGADSADGARLAPADSSSSRRCSRSLLRKSSNSSGCSAVNGDRALGLSFHHIGSPASQGKAASLQRHASLSSLSEQQPRQYSRAETEKAGLSTILSGTSMTELGSPIDQWAANEYQKLEGIPVDPRVLQQQEEADFTVGPSKYKQSKDMIKKKGQEWGDASTHQYELRRKVENLALGVRFGAFKAKRRLERGLHSG